MAFNDSIKFILPETICQRFYLRHSMSSVPVFRQNINCLADSIRLDSRGFHVQRNICLGCLIYKLSYFASFIV